VAAFVSLVIEVAIHSLTQARAGFGGDDTSLLVSSSLLAAMLAGGAALLVDVLAIQAAGSGIPEMQSILSGIWLHRYLSLNVLFTKVAALICAAGSGLSIGKEGPFVHIAGIISMQILKHSRYFGHLYHDGLYRLEILSAACACGVAATFGAPFSGVLFSIEVHHRGLYNVQACIP